MIKTNTVPTIAMLDDEEIVLTSVSSLLALETDYDIKTFTSAEKALDFVVNNPVNLVISDYLMPEMDGITFLSKVRAVKPEVPRIILTGYADKENAIKAINEIGLFYYIEKPWDNDDFLIIIRNGIEKHILSQKLLEKMEEITKAHADLSQIQTEIVKTFI